MELAALGRSGLLVSPLCFGSLTVGPLQANLPLSEGAGLIRYALERGVNFIDTAQLYDNYEYIRLALAGWPGEVVVASKSYAYSREAMRFSIEKARRELDRDVLDIFMLHEQESALTLAGHRRALDYLLEVKGKGLVRTVGISTHTVGAVLAAAEMEEIDIIHPLVNKAGLGILGGGLAEMLAAIHLAHGRGKGLYGMKALGGGNLMSAALPALEFAFGLSCLHSVAVGMRCREEVDVNVALAGGRAVSREQMAAVQGRRRFLHIEEWCTGCGSCLQACRYNALSLRNGRAGVDPSLCLLCGYCAAACPDFYIRVY